MMENQQKKKNSVKSDQCVSNFFLIAHSCCMYVNGTPNIMPAPLYLHLLYYTFILLLYILYKYIHIFFFSWLIYKKRKKNGQKKNTAAMFQGLGLIAEHFVLTRMGDGM